MANPSLLLLIPAFNEERRIEPVLRDYAQFFGAHYSGKFQIVVILNGCTDNTLGVVQKVAAEFPAVRALEFKQAIHKGGALIEGLKLSSHADFIGYVDADGATPPHAFLDLVRHMDHADCVVGSRWLANSVLHQEQTTTRKFFSRGFHFIVQLLFRLNIHDTQCGAKVMQREVVEKIHDAAHRGHGVRHQSARRHQIRRVPHPRGAHGMDGQGRFEGHFHAVPIVADDVAVRHPHPADLLARIYKFLRPLRPLEGWIYKKLRAPQPLSRSQVQSPKSKAD